MDFYKVLDHPSDLKLCIQGKTLAELFANAALAMAESQFEVEKESRPRKIKAIEVESQTVETLLVEFLSEILYLSAVDKLAYKDVAIERISPTGLRGRAAGVPIKANKLEIKAVTYHY